MFNEPEIWGFGLFKDKNLQKALFMVFYEWVQNGFS